MKLFMRPRDEGPQKPGSSVPRINKMSTPEIHQWLNSTLMALGSTYDGWRYRGESASEFSKQLEAANEMWRELMSREHGQPND